MIGISQVRNEADVVEVFVRHHLRCLDGLVVLDHGSVDDTPAILAALTAEGLPLEVRPLAGAAHHQDRAMTALMRECALERGADWVVPLDADEFLRVADPGATVREVLAAASDEQPLEVPWQTYLPAHGTEPVNPLERCTRRLTAERRSVHKVVVPRALAARATLRMGNHRLVLEGWLKRRLLVAQPSAELRLAHLPVRSGAQLRKKVLIGWLATLAKANRRREENRHWELLFARLRRGDLPDPIELRQIAVDYSAPDRAPWEDAEIVDDPIRSEGPTPLELRYPAGEAEDVLAPLLQLAEELARELASRG